MDTHVTPSGGHCCAANLSPCSSCGSTNTLTVPAVSCQAPEINSSLYIHHKVVGPQDGPGTGIQVEHSIAKGHAGHEILNPHFGFAGFTESPERRVGETRTAVIAVEERSNGLHAERCKTFLR